MFNKDKLNQVMEERKLNLSSVAKMCNVAYSTLYNHKIYFLLHNLLEILEQKNKTHSKDHSLEWVFAIIIILLFYFCRKRVFYTI